MPFFMVDDQLHSHVKTQSLIDMGQVGLAALGLWTAVGSQVQAQLGDGQVLASAWRLVGDKRLFNRLSKILVDVGFWEERDDGEDGFQYHDWADIGYQTGAKVKLNRARTKELKNPEIINAVVARDGVHCRYCGRKVNPKDRKSDAGRSYDHVIPGMPKGATNLVVACLGCNRKKAQRTPEQAGMTLLPPPFGPDSVTENAEIPTDLKSKNAIQLRDFDEGNSDTSRETAGQGADGAESRTRSGPDPDLISAVPHRNRSRQGKRRGGRPGDGEVTGEDPGWVGPAGRPPDVDGPPGHTGSPWHNHHGPPPDVDEPRCPDHGLDLPCRRCTAESLDGRSS